MYMHIKQTKLNNKMNKAQTAQQPWAPAACLFPHVVLACLLLCSVVTFDEKKKKQTQLLLIKKEITLPACADNADVVNAL